MASNSRRKTISGIFFGSILLLSACNSNSTEEKKIEKKILSQHEMDSLAKEEKDSLRMAALKKTATFPFINAGDGSGVLPVIGIDEIPDPNKEYNLLFGFSRGAEDTTNTKVNPGLIEIARVWNLHVASGIPANHIHIVILAHGKSLFSLLNQEAFKKKYKKENPNNKLIGQMMTRGAKFISCGQAMQFLEIKKEDLHDGIKVALTAQVVKSNYIEQGYVLYEIEGDD